MRIFAFTLVMLLACTASFCVAEEIGKDEQAVVPKAAATKTRSDEKPVKLNPDGEAHTPSIWMQQKLKQSQKIFAGMVQGDLFAVEDAARNLKFMSRLENFVKARHEGYRTQLRSFQFANHEILEGAREKNIDRVTLGYNQLTLSCVACHKQLRKANANANNISVQSKRPEQPR